MINKYGAMPLYNQLIEEIIRKIQEGEFPVKGKLPSEREFCDMYDVSRTTVRQAMQELERRGYVVCMHGKGNFVTEPAMHQQLLTIYSFSEEMKKIGKVPSTRLINYELIPCDAGLAQNLQLNTGELTYKIERVRFADTKPVMFVITYLPVNRFPGFDAAKLARGSLYRIMLEEYSLCLTEVQESMQAVSLQQREASFLETASGSPAMLICRKSFEKTRIVEYAVGIMRSDSFKYEVVLKNR
jgi:GntR family transcriptional regulator